MGAGRGVDVDTGTAARANLDDLPRQRQARSSRENLAELEQLAASLSAQAVRRERDQSGRVDDIWRPLPFVAQQGRRGLGAALALVVMAGILAGLGSLMMLTRSTPVRSGAGAVVPAASLDTVRQLGQAAGRRLVANGAVTSMDACRSAYAADAAASPLVLPKAAEDSAARRSYVAACTSVGSAG